MLDNPETAGRYADALDPGDFYKPPHETIWKAIHKVAATDRIPTPALVLEQIQADGDLARIGGAEYLHDLLAATAGPTQIGEYARIIVDHARWRTFDAGLRRVRQQLDKATPDTIGDTLADVLDLFDHEVIRQGARESKTGIQYVQLDGIFSRPRVRADWLIQPLIAAGRSTLLYSPGKAGKSLLAQEVTAALATGRAALDTRATHQPRHVLYVDQEMTEDDWADRLAAMGYNREDEHLLAEHLHLAQMQAWPPMDTPAGGTMVYREASRHRAELVIIDTASKVIAGEENSNDTQQAFYRSTIVPLKRDGIATLILDHTGKDIDRGARGGSAKTDNIDLAFELYNRGRDHLGLRCSHARFRDDALDDPTFLHRTTSPLAHIVEEYKASTDHGPGFRPTVLMEKVSKWLELNGGATKYAVEQARLHNKGERDTIRFALELLVNEGYVATEQGKRNSIRHRVVRPYRHAEDAGSSATSQTTEPPDNVVQLPIQTETPEDTP